MVDGNQRDRIERAQSEQMTVRVEEQDPLIVQVENHDSSRFSASRTTTSDGEVDNESSGTVHTVLPDNLYCSCEDSTYREFVCKHQIRVALEDNWIGDAMADALGHEMGELIGVEQDLQDRLESVRERRAALEAVHQELGPVEFDESGAVRTPSNREKVGSSNPSVVSLSDLEDDPDVSDDELDELESELDFDMMVNDLTN